MKPQARARLDRPPPSRLYATLAGLALVLMTSWSAGVVAADSPRVVVLGGAITEIAYALHRQDMIAAVDTTSLFPPEALKSKPNVGYVRAVSAEGVLALKPTMVLAIDGAGPPDALTLIRESGLRFVSVPDEATPEGIARKVQAVGAALSAPAEAQVLERDIAHRFETAAALRAQVKKPLRVLFVLSLQNGRSLVGGRGTAADGIIRLTGSINAAEGVDGYKTMADESIATAAPDVVLVMRNGGHALDADMVFAMPAYAATPAAKSRSLVAMDGLLMLGFGPRTPEAATELIRTLYPDLTAASR